MTITANDSREEYTASAGQTVFNYTFRIYTADDLNVYVTPAGSACSDADLTTAYVVDTATIDDPAGGFITLNVAASAGDLITINSAITENRTTDYQTNGDFIPATVNADFDRVVSLLKQIQTIVKRTPSFPECFQGGAEVSFDAPESLQYLRWKSDLSGIENVDLAASGLPTTADLISFTPEGSGAVVRDVQTKLGESVSVLDFDVVADGTDQYTKIEAALAVVRANKGKLFFPVNKDGTATVYSYSQTLQYNASDVVIEGESTSVQLTYTGVGTGLACKITPAGSAIERWGLRNISLVSSTGAIGLDYTGGNYGNYENVEINYTAANAEHLYAIGNTGAGPYFNKFDGMTFFGSAGRTQEAIVMKSDASGNLADGPNANVFTNIKRGASLSRLINLVAGTGNLFTNIGGESIKDAMIVLNEVPSFADNGTSTSTTSNTLTDTSKTWSTVLGNALNFVNDTVTLTSGIPGETRRIVSNTVDTLTLDKPFSQYPGAAVTYDISNSKAVKNMFVNVRQEGLDTDNPDCIRAVAGARGNEVSHIEAGSLGTGVVFDDQAQDQTNVVRQGDLMIASYQVLNPGASATVEVTPPRVSTLGGIRAGSNMTLEYVEMYCPNFVAGTATATLTVDHGGNSTGNGSETVVCIIDDVTDEQCYISADKVQRSTSNNGIFASLTTNANVNASADFYINIGYRVQ